MTEYELADLISSTSSNSLVIATAMISLASAYLVVAWLVGSKLQRSQIVLINILFIAFSFMFTLAWLNRIRVVLSYQDELLQINPDRLTVISNWLMPSAILFAVATLLACLKFMWDIRHPKKQ